MDRRIVLGAMLLSAVSVPGGAQPVPVPWKPLSTILQGVESKDARTVFSAENHRKRWEVVSCEGRRGMVCRGDIIDRATGAVIRSEREMVVDMRPPADGLRASAIARRIEAAGFGDIRELEWDTRNWEARVRNAAGRAEIDIDPRTGAVRRCEGPGCTK